MYETGPIRKNNLKTFTSLSKIKPVRLRGKEVILGADRDVTGRMLVVAQTKALNLRDVLCYELVQYLGRYRSYMVS